MPNAKSTVWDPPERDRDEAAHEASEEDEARQVLGAKRRRESRSAPIHGEGCAEQERRNDVLVERREDRAGDGDAVARKAADVLTRHRESGPHVTHLEPAQHARTSGARFEETEDGDREQGREHRDREHDRDVGCHVAETGALKENAT